MSFNKAKTVRAAEKFLAQGKITNAIAEYSRIVTEDPQDYNVLNMLGDLYVRTNKQADASVCFARVAEHYRKQGFALKAIAIYKKVLRHNPASLETMTALAELYASQGLSVEARAQYLQIADIHTQLGETRHALDTLLRISDLDPTNGEVRLRVAESFARENYQSEAADAYTDAGERFLERQKSEAALDAFNRALAINEQNLRALQGFVFAHIKLDSADEAAEVLEELVTEAVGGESKTTEATPARFTHELRLLLLRAYVAAENPIAAERTLHALITSPDDAAADPANLKNFLDIARLYLRVGDTDSGVRALAHAIEPMLTEREDAALLAVLGEVLARNPEHLEALKYTARIYSWKNDEAQQRATLERLIEVANDQANQEEERRAIKQLIAFTTPELRYTERLRELGSHLVIDDSDAAQQHTAGETAPVIAKQHESAIPTFESFMFEDGAGTETRAPQNNALYENNALSGTREQLGWQSEWQGERNFNADASEVETNVAQFEIKDASVSFADLNDDANASVNSSSGQSAFASQEFEFADLSKSETLSEASVSLVSATEAASDYSVFENSMRDSAHDESSNISDNSKSSNDAFNNFNVTLDDFKSSEAIHSADASSPPSAHDALHGELESVDFYLAQGYTDIARETLDTLERQHGAHPEIRARRAQLETAALSGETILNQVTTDEQAASVSTPHTTAALSAGDKQAGDKQSERLSVNQGALDEGLAAIFDDFKAEVERLEPISTADYETHYNLGIAYQEMGLLDEAVEEFQKAANLAPAGDGTPRYLQCCNMLGHCFAGKEMYTLAAMWFSKGLEIPNHTEDEYQALRYELGNVYEKMGDFDQATNAFMQVYGINVSYRGVAERLRDLQGKASLVA